jgi:phage N-6-adenine-methyltransferase
MQEIEFHPIANIFPLLEGEAFDSLCQDVLEKGLLEPIWLYEGQVLDGRNRYRACEKTGVEPQFREYEGEDPIGFVVSLNVQRRHLDESQRAMIAARIATIGRGGDRSKLPIGSLKIEEASAMLNAGDRSVARASKVLDHGTAELIAAVDAGEIKVSAAAELTSLPKEEQNSALEGLKELNEGRVTAVAASRAVKVMTGKINSFSISTDNYEWYTPTEYIEAAREVMGGIDLDPASSDAAQEVVQASVFFGKEFNGLTQPWFGRVFLNPPYSAGLVRDFITKAVFEYDEGRIEAAIILVNNATDTDWFQLALSRFPACFTDGRVKFWSPESDKACPRQGQTFFYLGADSDMFLKLFSKFGVVVGPL